MRPVVGAASPLQSARCTGIPHEFDQTLTGFVSGGTGRGVPGAFYSPYSGGINGTKPRAAQFNRYNVIITNV